MSNMFKQDDKGRRQLNFNAKEIGFLIRMIEEMAISGKVLELAYQTKVKLQAKLNEIANNEMEF
tara:strand:+ start:350 stop:541 length:192 start_codon:yes stop_codon:yes gene_type:complete